LSAGLSLFFAEFLTMATFLVYTHKREKRKQTNKDFTGSATMLIAKILRARF